jgi:Protein of unknown function (DUF3551)
MAYMRRSLRARAGIWPAALMMLVGATTIAGVASAQPINGRARWCVTLSHFGGTLDCAYHSLEQCMASALGVSNQCSLNSWYVERPGPRPRKRVSRR